MSLNRFHPLRNTIDNIVGARRSCEDAGQRLFIQGGQTLPVARQHTHPWPPSLPWRRRIATPRPGSETQHPATAPTRKTGPLATANGGARVTLMIGRCGVSTYHSNVHGTACSLVCHLELLYLLQQATATYDLSNGSVRCVDIIFPLGVQ